MAQAETPSPPASADLFAGPQLASHREEFPGKRHDFIVHVETDPRSGPLLPSHLNRTLEIEGPAADLKIRTAQSVDMSSAATIVNQILSEDMSDREKAIRLWEFVGVSTVDGAMRLRIRSAGPWSAEGIMDQFRSQGMGVCGYQRDVFSVLCTAAGLENRRWAIGTPLRNSFHAVNEVFYEGAWHCYDPSYKAYYLARDNRTVTDLEELGRDPYLIRRCPYHLWYANNFWQGPMDSPAFKAPPFQRLHQNYISCVTSPESNRFLPPLEHRPDGPPLDLKNGERLLVTWSNPGGGGLNKIVPTDYLWRLANRYPYVTDSSYQYVAAKGLFSYKALWVPGDRQPETSECEGLEGLEKKARDEEKGRVVLRMANGAKSGHIVYSLTNPYLLTASTVRFRPALADSEDSCRVSIATDAGGTSWREVWSGRGAESAADHAVDLTERVLARRDYRLRFEFSREDGASPAGLDELSVTREVQINHRALPALTPGENAVSVTCRSEDASADPRAITYTWLPNTHIAFAPGEPTWGDQVRITGTVVNRGKGAAKDVRVRFHKGHPSSGKQIGTDQIIPSIAPGATAKPSVVWDTTGQFGVCDITMQVRSAGGTEVREKNRALVTHNPIRVVRGPYLEFDPTLVLFEESPGSEEIAIRAHRLQPGGRRGQGHFGPIL